jgi:NhaP-type Na+/H+ or K+/H+ antiporter
VAAVATLGTNLKVHERTFIGAIDPRGIVAASTAVTFSAPLAQAGIDGASELLPVTCLVIVGTVTVYALAAVPTVRLLGLSEPDSPSVADNSPESA